eukprot:7895302-Lingulodinium_polyedra.AAC.1
MSIESAAICPARSSSCPRQASLPGRSAKSGSEAGGLKAAARQGASRRQRGRGPQGCTLQSMGSRR